MSDITTFQKTRLISCVLRHADSDGEVDFEDDDFDALLGKILRNYDERVNFFSDLDKQGVLQYDHYFVEGLPAVNKFNVSDSTHAYLEELLNQLNMHMTDLETRIADILSFDPIKLSKQIKETEKHIIETKNSISTNEILQPLEKPLNAIIEHFDSAKSISESYEEIFKNIVRPIQTEGRQSVRTTVRWAIFSIIGSVLLSWILSNWNNLVSLFTNS